MKTTLLTISSLFFCACAHSRPNDDWAIFAQYEFNDTDKITGVGVSQRFVAPRSDVGGEFSTSLNYAEILTEEGYIEDYLGWEMGVKLGYFSEIFFYIEAGLDLAETLFESNRENCCLSSSHENNSIDGYAGAGAGIQLGGLRIEIFSRARQIDGLNWRSESQVFFGSQLSIVF